MEIPSKLPSHPQQFWLRAWLTSKVTREFAYNGTFRGLHKEPYCRIDIINEFNCIEQIHKRLQAPFELNKKKLISRQIVYF